MCEKEKKAKILFKIFILKIDIVLIVKEGHLSKHLKIKEQKVEQDC